MSRKTRIDRSDSTAERLDGVLFRLTASLGRAVTCRELNAAYAQRYGEAKWVTTVLSVLVRRRIAMKAGGRLGFTRYMHRDLPVAAGEDDPVDVAIIEIVRAHAQDTGAPMPTGEVHRSMLERGIKQSMAATISRLQVLVKASTYRARNASTDWQKPPLRETIVQVPGGKTRHFWGPAEFDVTAPRHLSDPACLRLAVRTVEEVLGRPVSGSELQAWADANASGRGDQALAAQAVLKPRVGKRLQTAAYYDAERKKPGDRLHVVRTPFTCAGALPPRFTVAMPSVEQTGPCLAEDVANLTVTADEIASIGRLRDMADELGSATFVELANAREATLVALLAGLAPAEADPGEWWVAAIEKAACACGAVAKIGRHGSGVSKHASVTTRHLEVLADLVGGRDRPNLRSHRASIADAAGRRQQTFETLVAESFALNGREMPRNWPALLKKARRVMAQTGGSRLDFDSRSYPLDRPDAILAIVRACYLPQMNALVELAAEALGFVLRDRSVLIELLKGLGPADAVERQALIVACGLLGSTPPIEIAVPDPGDPEAVAAYAAAVALGEDDADERLRLATAADIRAIGNAAEVTGLAVERLEAGCRLAVLD